MDFGEDEASASASSSPAIVTPPKRQRFHKKSPLEQLPRDLLVKILCFVEHDDLKRLFFVSTTVRAATLEAKQRHFAYCTPKKTIGFLDEDSVVGGGVPNAPKQVRVRKGVARTLCQARKKLTQIVADLFPSGEERRRCCWCPKLKSRN